MESVIHTARISIDLDSRTVEVKDRPLRLTPKEYAILELLCLRKGTTVSRETLLHHLYRGDDEPDPGIINVFVCNLRKKLMNATAGDNYIETVWGQGYLLRDPPPRD